MSEDRIFIRREVPTTGPIGHGGRAREVAAAVPERLRPDDADRQAMVAWMLSTPRFIGGAPAKYAMRLGLSAGLAQRLETEMLTFAMQKRLARREGDFWVVTMPI